MEHLSVVEAGFLRAEDSDPHVSLAIGAIAVLAGPMPDFAVLVETLAERVLSVPRLRQVLRTHRLDLGAPDWVDDPDVDIRHHVRRAALPRPGDDAALFRWAADVMERRLDRDRPLWECWVVDGLAHNRWAMLMKIHHCIADGVAAAQLLAGMCDGGAGAIFATKLRAAKEPSSGWRLWALPLNPIDWVTGAWATMRGAADLAGGLLRPAAPSSLSSLTGPVTTMRRYATVEVPMEDVATICDRFDVTVNDVALAAITAGFRRMLLRRGEQPERTSLRTLVPVSMRSAEDRDQTDNRVSVMLPCLPVEKADPVQQLRTVHHRLTKTKGSGQRQAASLFTSAVDNIPFALTAWAIRALTHLPQRGVVTLATNVPGPRTRQFVLGREVVRLLPVPPLALRLRTGIAILSYADHLAFGIIGDYDAAPDVDGLAQGIERAVAQLVAIGAGPWRSTPIGTLALVQGG